MSETAYVVGSQGDEGFCIDRIYLDREEAEQFVEAHNAVDYGYKIEEWPIGAPPAEYDGPVWHAEWIDRFWLEDKFRPNKPAYEPRWIEEKLIIRSEWHTGSAPSTAEIRMRRTNPEYPGMVVVKGASKEAVEALLHTTIAEVKTEMARS